MDNFKILIRLLTNQGCRSDIAFNFDAESEAHALAAAARACMERADMMPTDGGILQLDVSVCDCRARQLERITIRPNGARAVFERDSVEDTDRLPYFAMHPEDGDMFHLAAHGLLAETQSRALSINPSLR
ncbi:MAG TPA: hypothetical protein VIF60_24115 [Burkholderiaceae bacterium]|jgi:hypothetical protein